MRKTLAVGAMIAVLAGSLTAAKAAPTIGGFASDNVEYVTHVPLHNDTAGAALVDEYFYITTERDLTIYDVSDPVNPQRVGFTLLAFPGEPYFTEEDPETNGKILLVGNGGDLYVYDVEDKTNPTLIGEVAGADEHTISCVLDCKWAYGSAGVIVDLRDPTNPEIAGDWKQGTPAGQSHDVTEVKPGLVMTSTQPMMLLDARKDPAHPKVLAVGGNDDGRYIHSNLWPRGMKDRFLLVGGETSGPRCDGANSGAFMTWDTKGWKKTKTFTMIDEYRPTNGLPTDGNAPANLFCTHWFTTQPGFRNGGLVAMAWYEHGTRFFDIDKKGKISEAGWFVPYAGSTSASYWITDEIVYAADYNRGLDILRYTGE